MLTKTLKDSAKKKAILHEVANYLVQKDPQLAWFKNARRSPVNRVVFSEIVKTASGNDKVMLEVMAQAVYILPDYRISAMWPAMRKGLRLFISGVRTAEDAAAYILRFSH
jgi:hypothetical protein